MSAQDEGVISRPRGHFSLTWAVLVVTVCLGCVARFYRLGTLPPGLYHDEAFNGLDALGVLRGERPLFFEANNGREPLFLYSMALPLSVLGRTPFAVRVMAAILGTLTVPSTFLMARALFGERVGLWSAFLIATAPWPINLSRIGLRAVSMPLIVSLAVWLWWTGRRPGSTRRVVRSLLGGALMGLSLYTYTAARFAPIAVLVFVLFQSGVSRERLPRSELYFALAAVLAMSPLLGYWFAHWEIFLERLSQVSIFSPGISDGNPLGPLVRNLVRAAGLFTFYGDSIPRHNVPLRPLFDPLISVFFLMGVLLSLRRLRKGASCAFALIWTGTMLLPTVLAEDCPHFLRAVGVLPMAAIFPALGLEWAAQRLRQRGLGHVGNLVIGVALGIACLWGGYDYFLRHGTDPELGYWFEADQVQEAIEINHFLGSGWQGEGIREPRGEPISDRRVYLGPRLWEDRLTVSFLVTSPHQVSILGRDPPSPAQEVLALAWPHGDMRNAVEVLVHPAQIDVWLGPMERGDLDTEPRLLYVAFRATRPARASLSVAQFEQGVELLGWDIEPEKHNGTRLSLYWRATRPLSTDYTVFVHLVHEDEVIVQADNTPGNGFFPTTWWEPGDVVVDVHLLSTPYDADQEQIFIGLYELSSMQNLRVLDKNLQPGENRLELR